MKNNTILNARLKIRASFLEAKEMFTRDPSGTAALGILTAWGACCFAITLAPDIGTVTQKGALMVGGLMLLTPAIMGLVNARRPASSGSNMLEPTPQR